MVTPGLASLGITQYLPSNKSELCDVVFPGCDDLMLSLPIIRQKTPSSLKQFVHLACMARTTGPQTILVLRKFDHRNVTSSSGP
uniref:Uncharacterized protein n=1 Tax=Peronospora matthiolae TaxID=2874970 RepID=A0AAV1UQU9_9STRA